MKIYLIAGEPSGDLLGSRLMRAMTSKCENVSFFGVGGESMQREGLKSLFDISDLAVMGLLEVVPSIPRVLKRIRQTVQNIQEVNPDIVITIDSWSFSARIHKALRKLKLSIPQVHYVAPQVWAWKKKRARTMYKYIDHLLTLFPYEPKYFTPYRLEASFVGHPVIESPVIYGNSEDFRLRFNIEPNQKIMALLPGSRKNEVARLLPVFLEAAEVFYQKNPEYVFVLPTVHTVENEVLKITQKSNLPIIVVKTESDRHDAFCASDVAMAASGTVALELAIVKVPHIIAYKVAPLTAFLVRHFLKIQFVNLTNILLGREIVPELLQENCSKEKILYYMNEFIKKGDVYERQMEGFEKLKSVLGFGEQTPSANACDIILSLIENRRKDVRKP
ncbi:MAG: lipid-A-disaccharide synthase [Alphaproteobacteria bacterium]|nr:lipid-A-disaccharide synthase [Alphaproteobacteria bacterium]